MSASYRIYPAGTLKRHRLIASALMFVFALAATVAPADPKDQKTAKPSSFAPHHSGKHVYGAPIQHPILHKRHKTSRKTSRSEAIPPGQRTDSGAH